MVLRLLRVPWNVRRSNQSILKEISPRCSLEGLMLKLKLQYFGHLMRRADSFEKTPMLGKIEGRKIIFLKRLLFMLTYNGIIIQFSSVTQLCPTLCDPMNCSTTGLPVHHQFPESTQTHIHRVDDTTLPSHPLSSTSPPVLNLSQHQGLFQ